MKWKQTVTACAVLIAFAGCSPSEDKPGTDPNTNPPPPGTGMLKESQAGEAVAKAVTMTESKEGYIASCGQKLKDLNAKIDQLNEKAATATGEVKTQADELVSSLRQQQEKVAERMEQLKSASAEAWSEVKAGFDAALTELEKACDDARAKLG